jgi:hypothetical protein
VKKARLRTRGSSGSGPGPVSTDAVRRRPDGDKARPAFPGRLERGPGSLSLSLSHEHDERPGRAASEERRVRYEGVLVRRLT